MTKCSFCNSSIIMGGVRAGNDRFCNNKCLQNAGVLNATRDVPAKVWQGQCPKCHQNGPIDLHKIHQVWSIFLLTRWTSRTQVSCRSCATKSQLQGTAFSLVCGWWGIPWGLVLTPVQITRNIMGMTSGPDPSRPSEALRRAVLVSIGSKLLAKQQEAAAPSSPV